VPHRDIEDPDAGSDAGSLDDYSAGSKADSLAAGACASEDSSTS
jgi:hypothetical protein